MASPYKALRRTSADSFARIKEQPQLVMGKVAPKQFAVQGKVFRYCQLIEFIFCKPALFNISYVDKGIPEKFTQGGTPEDIGNTHLHRLMCVSFSTAAQCVFLLRIIGYIESNGS